MDYNPEARTTKNLPAMVKGAGFTADNSLGQREPTTRQLTDQGIGSTQQPIFNSNERKFYDEQSSRPDVPERRSEP